MKSNITSEVFELSQTLVTRAHHIQFVGLDHWRGGGVRRVTQMLCARGCARVRTCL